MGWANARLQQDVPPVARAEHHCHVVRAAHLADDFLCGYSRHAAIGEPEKTQRAQVNFDVHLKGVLSATGFLKCTAVLPPPRLPGVAQAP